LFCAEIIAWRKPLYSFAGEANANLLALGARVIDPGFFAGSNPDGAGTSHLSRGTLF
jgi:hypothetical protein